MNKLNIFFSHEQVTSITLSNGEDAVVLALASYKCEEGAHPVRENQPDIAGWVNTQTRHCIDLAQESSSQITFTPEMCKGHYASLVTSSTSSEVMYKTHHDNLVVTLTNLEVRCKR